MNNSLWKLCRVLANKNRLGILRQLKSDTETCVSDIAIEHGLTRPSASKHIRFLSANLQRIILYAIYGKFSQKNYLPPKNRSIKFTEAQPPSPMNVDVALSAYFEIEACR